MGRRVACDSPHGRWSQFGSGWCKAVANPPGFEDPVWRGRTDGSVAACTAPNGSLDPDPGARFLRWLPGPPGAAPVVDPSAVARTLLAQLDLEAVELGMQPRGDTAKRMGFVGWQMWLWAQDPSESQFGTRSASVSEGGVTVSLTASVDEVVWEMGNGDSVVCGKGTPWSLNRTGGRNVASPDCGYVYEEQGVYTVTATTAWDVSWSAGGVSGTIPFELSRSAEVMVGELQSVVVANG